MNSAIMRDDAVRKFLSRASYSRQSFVNDGLKAAEQITITASTGAGKSELLKRLKRLLPAYEFRSGGAWFRERARERGYGEDIGAFCAHCRMHPEEGHDRECDASLYLDSLLYPWLVLESRFSHCAVPNGFHVLLTCDLDTRAFRRHADPEQNPDGLSVGTIRNKIMNRDEDDEKRLIMFYPDYLWPESDFDLVLPTDKTSKDQAAQLVFVAYQDWRDKILMERMRPSPPVPA